MLASALRTDPHCLRRLESTDPAIIELREWSRLNDDLTRERVRLANRMRDQLWRYNPQFLDAVDDDVAAPWALDLWRSLPTPRAGQRVREVTLTRVLKQHRIRRIDAATLRSRLRVPVVKVAPGAAEAAATHVRLVAERLALVNRQLDRARRELARLVRQLAEPAATDDPDASGEAEPGSSNTPRDAAILRSLPGIGVGVLATLLAEGGDAVRRRDYDALRCLCGVAPVTLGVRARACSSRAVWPPTTDCATRPSTGRASPPNAIRSATTSIRRSAPAATDTPAPCAQWLTACSTSPVRCCVTARVSTRTVSGARLLEPDSSNRSSWRPNDLWPPGFESRAFLPDSDQQETKRSARPSAGVRVAR